MKPSPSVPFAQTSPGFRGTWGDWPSWGQKLAQTTVLLGLHKSHEEAPSKCQPQRLARGAQALF